MADGKPLRLRGSGAILIEQLVGVLVAAMMLLALSHFFVVTTQTTYRLMLNSREQLQVNTLFDQIELDVENAVNYWCRDGNHDIPIALDENGGLNLELIDLSRRGRVEHLFGGFHFQSDDAEPLEIYRSIHCKRGDVHLYDPVDTSLMLGCSNVPVTCATTPMPPEGDVFAIRHVTWQLRGERISRFESKRPLSGRGIYDTMLSSISDFRVETINLGYEIIGVRILLERDGQQYTRDIRW